MKPLPCESDSCKQSCDHPQAICLTKAEMVPEEEASRAAELFKILGDPSRIKILYALSKRDHCVCDLATIVAMGQSAVSHQLRLLRGARLVKYRKEGKMVWYSLDDEHVFSLLIQGIEHINHK